VTLYVPSIPKLNNSGADAATEIKPSWMGVIVHVAPYNGVILLSCSPTLLVQPYAQFLTAEFL
jgi:hypothetical protein